jgi:acyl CoA:acetate/3-ketoacid CoA transferase alpha subunit
MIALDTVLAEITDGASLLVGGFMPPACWSK